MIKQFINKMSSILQSVFTIALFTVLTMSSCILTEPDAPCDIIGKVTNTQGQGLADVIVRLDSATVNTMVTTSANGEYKINLPVGGVSKLIFEKEGYTSKSQIVTLASGQILTINTSLKTKSEDAVFKLNLTDPNIAFPNNGGDKSVLVTTNINYDIENNASWITCTKTTNGITLSVIGNDTFDERNANVVLKAEYGLSYTIKIKQSAGPFLELVDYIGKDKKTSFLTSVPFISFNRPITLISASSGMETLNLNAQYSSDRKTIYFPNIKTTPFSTLSINFTVESDEKFRMSSKFNLYLFNSFKDVELYRSMFFSSNNKYLWLYTGLELIQYAVSDFSEISKISLPGSAANKLVVYNAYNNSIYYIQHQSSGTKTINNVKVYNANNATLNNEIQIDVDNKTISALAFNSKGYGVMILGDKLYNFDSSNNHTYTIISNESGIYDPANSSRLLIQNINTCDNNNVIVLDGTSQSGNKYVFTVNPNSKEITKIYQGTEPNIACAAFSKGFFKYANNGNLFSYFNINTSQSVPFTINSNIKALYTIKTDAEIADALTSDLLHISLSKNTSVKYAYDSSVGSVTIKSSDDGMYVAIFYGSRIYIFDSNIFNTYSAKLKIQ